MGSTFSLIVVNFTDQLQSAAFTFPIGGDYAEQIEGGQNLTGRYRRLSQGDYHPEQLWMYRDDGRFVSLDIRRRDVNRTSDPAVQSPRMSDHLYSRQGSRPMVKNEELPLSKSGAKNHLELAFLEHGRRDQFLLDMPL